MATLHVRSVPDELYVRLQELAAVRQRSLSAQVITLLEQALSNEERQQQQTRLLAGIRRRRFVPPAGSPDSVALLREDRGR
jgi:plasmid stability protein